MKQSTIFPLVAAVTAMASLSSAAAPVGSTFTYQGQLKRGGAPLNDTCAFEFKLFDAAATGSQVGTTQVLADQTVVNGLLTLDLDFGPTAFDGNGRWLEVALQCSGDVSATVLAPRQRLTATPHAANANVLDGLDSSAFLRGIPNPLSLTGSQASGHIIKGGNSSATSGAAGVLGQATAAGGNTFGVWGSASSSGGIGVLGQHTSISGTFAGVVGESSSGASNASGVYGKVNGTAAVNYGVFGESPSTAGRGVYGKATALSGTTYGIYGDNVSAGGAGVFGFGGDGDGLSGRSDGDSKSGVFGHTTSAHGWGVYGKHTSPAGERPGVQGETASLAVGAKGVYGLATNTTGNIYGVYGECASNAGQGVFGVATSAMGTTIGVQGETRSTTNGAAGVVGLASAGLGKTYGVLGQSASEGGYSVYGNHAGSGRGVYGASAGGVGVYATTVTGSFALYAERTVNGNKVWLGGLNEAAGAESGNGTALIGKTTNGTTAIYGERTANGNKGWFGGINEGAWGQATQGSGVSGVTTDALGYGGYFRNDGGGTALFADGHAIVRTLEIIDGGDLAEPFEVRGEGMRVEPGAVVVIDPANPGALKLSTQAYDRKVAGVVSGANGLSAGMVMKGQARGVANGDHQVALTGRVWCWCDASQGAISPGDLLTTSATPGHAMKAADLAAAQGAIIGKAMTPLDHGRGLVLLLVNLQ